jgi:hypothetical protein
MRSVAGAPVKMQVPLAGLQGECHVKAAQQPLELHRAGDFDHAAAQPR